MEHRSSAYLITSLFLCKKKAKKRKQKSSPPMSWAKVLWWSQAVCCCRGLGLVFSCFERAVGLRRQVWSSLILCRMLDRVSSILEVRLLDPGGVFSFKRSCMRKNSQIVAVDGQVDGASSTHLAIGPWALFQHPMRRLVFVSAKRDVPKSETNAAEHSLGCVEASVGQQRHPDHGHSFLVSWRPC